MNETSRDFYEATSRVLIRAFALGMALQLFWLIMLLALDHQWVVDLHSRAIGGSITLEQFVMLNYTALTAMKIFCMTVFLIPWLAIRWALRDSRD
ncbi:MAG: hypothetical protein CMO64_07880 [Verrucomicrobiales bacterium]|nr:hypothetical protein [Verrucomicrobiales bacterium]